MELVQSVCSSSCLLKSQQDEKSQERSEHLGVEMAWGVDVRNSVQWRRAEGQDMGFMRPGRLRLASKIHPNSTSL